MQGKYVAGPKGANRGQCKQCSEIYGNKYLPCIAEKQKGRWVEHGRRDSQTVVLPQWCNEYAIILPIIFYDSHSDYFLNCNAVSGLVIQIVNSFSEEKLLWFLQYTASYTDYWFTHWYFSNEELNMDESRSLWSSFIKRDTIISFKVVIYKQNYLIQHE